MSATEVDPGRVVRGLRARLEHAGIRPSRFRGQNFLLDENLLRAITRDAEVAPGDRVLEVGCGPGTLTAFLLAAGAEVLSVEIETRLLALARESLGADPHWQALEGDVLAGKHELAPALLERLSAWGSYDLVANLPYAITTPLLLLLAACPVPPRRMTVLVQKEAADRLCAGPGTKAYGAATVRLGLRYRGRITRPVPSQVFWPRPQVDSAVARFDRRPDELEPAVAEWVARLVERGFASRRKQLLGQLAALVPPARLAAEAATRGWRPELRAEELAPEEWVDLARALASCPP